MASSNDGLQQMARLVNTFLNKPETLAFRAPVDPKAMNIPDYPQIVKKPMDLGTVKAKLEDGKYEGVEDVARDIRLIWANCILYNSAVSEFGVLAAGLSKKFEERYSKIAEKEREKKAVVKQDPVDARAPSLEEKVRFTNDLYRTTRVEVGQVIMQVDARCPQALKSTADDEVELNVDMLDPLSFRVVEKIVRDVLQGGGSAPASSGSGSLATTPSSNSKSKSGGSGGGNKKRKGSDGEARPKKRA